MTQGHPEMTKPDLVETVARIRDALDRRVAGAEQEARRRLRGSVQTFDQLLDDELAHATVPGIRAADLRDILALPGLAPAPVKMILHCPACGVQHIDEGDSHDEAAEKMLAGKEPWDNPPHRSHLCHGCGHIWRPADVPTEGVAAIETRGKADSPPASPDLQAENERLRGAVSWELFAQAMWKAKGSWPDKFYDSRQEPKWRPGWELHREPAQACAQALAALSEPQAQEGK